MKIYQALVIVLTLFLFWQIWYFKLNPPSFQFKHLNNVDFFDEKNSDYPSFNLMVKQNDKDFYKNWIVPIFMIVAGIGIAGIWTVDLVKGRFSKQGNFFTWREGENMLWPHITAEYLTSAALITGGIALYNFKDWAIDVSFVALGALIYTSMNSTGWVLAEKERLAYGIPMWVCLIGSIIALIILLN